MEYSVLMSVYTKEEPAYLDTAIQSMLDQTVRTDDFVIVCDGPLTAELDAVLERILRKILPYFILSAFRRILAPGQH